MIEKTVADIEAKIKAAGTITDQEREELLFLVTALRSEMTELCKTDAEGAESIAGFARVSTHEATRENRDPELMKHSVEGLSSSVGGFEASHPKLVEVVNRIAHILSNMGI